MKRHSLDSFKRGPENINEGFLNNKDQRSYDEEELLAMVEDTKLPGLLAYEEKEQPEEYRTPDGIKQIKEQISSKLTPEDREIIGWDEPQFNEYIDRAIAELTPEELEDLMNSDSRNISDVLCQKEFEYMMEEIRS